MKMNRGRPGIAVGVILVAVLVIGLWVGPGTLGRATPALYASPNPVERGAVLTLTGSGFQGHPFVLLRWSDGEPDVYISPSGGRFTWSGTVPFSAPDTLVIKAYDARTMTALAVAVPG